VDSSAIEGSGPIAIGHFVKSEVAVFARIAVWEPMPGVLGAYHLVDPGTGNGMSISFFEDDVDVSKVKAAIADKAREIGWNDVPRPTPSSETIYQVLRGG
jgi:hypothetical protein